MHAPLHHDVLDHLLAQIVVDAVDLFLAEETRKVLQETVERTKHTCKQTTSGGRGPVCMLEGVTESKGSETNDRGRT